MQIKTVKRTRQVTYCYSAKITIHGKEYTICFNSVDGVFEHYTKVTTADLTYFDLSEKTRKAHYEQILKHIEAK